MVRGKKDLSKIVHISRKTHSKLKQYVTNKQIKGKSTSLSNETEIAIINHIKAKG